MVGLDDASFTNVVLRAKGRYIAHLISYTIPMHMHRERAAIGRSHGELSCTM